MEPGAGTVPDRDAQLPLVTGRVPERHVDDLPRVGELQGGGEQHRMVSIPPKLPRRHHLPGWLTHTKQRKTQIPCRFDLSQEGVLILGFMQTWSLMGGIALLAHMSGAAITHGVCININAYIQDFGKAGRD